MTNKACRYASESLFCNCVLNTLENDLSLQLKFNGSERSMSLIKAGVGIMGFGSNGKIFVRHGLGCHEENPAVRFLL